MGDLSILREQALAAPEVLVKSEVLLELLNSVTVITLEKPKSRKRHEPRPADPEDTRCAKWLFDVLRRTAPRAKEPNFATWSNDVRLMRERDGRMHKEICELFLWAHKDSFWCTNILSPKKLRDQWDRLDLQRAKAAEAKKPNNAWWTSDETRLAKAIEVGVGPARPGDTKESYEARIRAAIDNGGKPPAPQVYVRPAAPIECGTGEGQDENRAPKPAGFLKAALKEIQQKAAA